MNSKKRKIIILSIVIIILIIGSFIIIKLVFKDKDNNPNKNTNDVNSTEPIFGIEKIEAQKEVINIIRSSFKESDLLKYGKENKIDIITLKEASEKLNVDISDYENSKYNCDSSTTLLSFDENYEKYIISLNCKRFYLKDESKKDVDD